MVILQTCSCIMQRLLNAVKIIFLNEKKEDIFPIFAQNIDYGYSFMKAVLTSNHNLCF